MLDPLGTGVSFKRLKRTLIGTWLGFYHLGPLTYIYQLPNRKIINKRTWKNAKSPRSRYNWFNHGIGTLVSLKAPFVHLYSISGLLKSILKNGLGKDWD